MACTLDKRGLTPYLLTHKLRYSVSIFPNNDIFMFIFSPYSVYFCKKLELTFSLQMSFVYNQHVVYVSTYHIKPLEEFRYLFLEDIGAITKPHR